MLKLNKLKSIIIKISVINVNSKYGTKLIRRKKVI